MSYDDTKVVEAAGFLRSVAEGVPHGATIEDAVRSAEALEAMERSAATAAWIAL
jgi:predicted dehydrogenase